MLIEKNAFYILEASIFDSRHKLVQTASEKSLFVDADICEKAKNILLNPQKRLGEEMRWFLGCSREEESQAIECILDVATSADKNLSVLPPLTQINIILYQSYAWNIDDIAGIKYITLQLSRLYEQIDSKEVMTSINSARSEAGFPAVSELHEIETELSNTRLEIQHTLTSILAGLSANAKTEAMRKIVEKSADDQRYSGSTVIDDLVAAYALDIDRELKRQKQQIINLLGYINKGIDQINLNAAIEDLVSLVVKWDELAQPLQLDSEAKGLVHQDSEELAFQLRELAIELHNNHGQTAAAFRLIKSLRNVFAEIPEYAEKVDEDAAILEKMLTNISPPLPSSTIPVVPRKKNNTAKWIGGLIVVIVGIWLLSSLGGNSESNTSKPSSTPAAASAPTAQTLVEQTMPSNGHVFYSKYSEKPCAFEIENNSTSAYYMKFVDISTNSDIIVFFVKPNSTVSIDIPVGNFELRYAFGTTWYGEQDLFGKNTGYAKDEEAYPFESDSYSSTIWTVSFYGANNNDMDTMYTENIDANDF